MITRIRLATPIQIAALTLTWLAALFLIDITKNQHLWPSIYPVVVPRRPAVPLSFWVNHLCCSGCLDDVRAALETLPWIEPGAVRARKGNGVLSAEEAERLGPLGEYGGWVDVQVKDSALDSGVIDFVSVDRALREKGLVASKMELGGVAHIRLEAQVEHLCCGVCEGAVERTTELTRALSNGRLRWVDSVTTNRAKKVVVVYARYLEPDETIDVAELLGAMDQMGFAPFSLRVLTGGERAPTPDRPPVR